MNDEHKYIICCEDLIRNFCIPTKHILHEKFERLKLFGPIDHLDNDYYAFLVSLGRLQAKLDLSEVYYGYKLPGLFTYMFEGDVEQW